MAHDVFISYSHKDSYVAQAICAKLEENKIRCWYAPRNILPGEEWATSIINALKSAKVMILIFTDFSNASVQVRREIDNAITDGVPIIPFKLSSAKPEESMKYYLSTLHWLDAVDKPLEKSIDELLKLVIKVLEKGDNSIYSDWEKASDGKGRMTVIGVLKLVFSVPFILSALGIGIALLFFISPEKNISILLICGAVLLLILGLHMLITPLAFRKKNKMWIATLAMCLLTIGVGVVWSLAVKASMPRDLKIKDHGDDATMNMSNDSFVIEDNDGNVYYADKVNGIPGVYKAAISDFKNNKPGECIVADVHADNLALTDDGRLIYRDRSSEYESGWKLVSFDLNDASSCVLADSYTGGCYASDNWVLYSDNDSVKVVTSDGKYSLTYLDETNDYIACYQDDLYFINDDGELTVSDRQSSSSTVSSIVNGYFMIYHDTAYTYDDEGIYGVPLAHTDVSTGTLADAIPSAMVLHDRYLYYIDTSDHDSLYRTDLTDNTTDKISSSSYTGLNIIENCLYLCTSDSEYVRMLVI